MRGLVNDVVFVVEGVFNVPQEVHPQPETTLVVLQLSIKGGIQHVTSQSLLLQFLILLLFNILLLHVTLGISFLGVSGCIVREQVYARLFEFKE